MRLWVDAALSLLFAPECAVCEDPLAHPTRSAVCDRCWRSILPVRPPLCACCGDLILHADKDGLCPRCRHHPPPIVCTRSLGLYEGTLRDIVHALKYDGRRSLARTLATMWRERCAEIVARSDVAVPVPLHAARRRERGFNQAEDLARAIGVPMVPALKRIRRTQVQADLGADDRLENVAGAFAATRRAAALRHQTVVLVDDVTTTGATLNACATTLRDAGVATIYALTAARTATRPR